MSEQASSAVLPAYTTLDLTATFCIGYASKQFTDAERRMFEDALGQLDSLPPLDKHGELHNNSTATALRLRLLTGDLAGIWSAAPSHSLRMTFLFTHRGRKVMLTCSRDSSPR